jgi:Helix-turn-helix of insertion element transposase
MSHDPTPADPPPQSDADFDAPIACKMVVSRPPGGPVGHSGDDWDFSEISELTERQLRAIELCLQGFTDVQIAQRLSINRKTLWRWKTLDDDYRRVLANARTQAYAAITDRYQQLLPRAMAVLAKFLEDPADDRAFAAALAILNMAGAFRPLPHTHFPTTPPPGLPALPPPEPPNSPLRLPEPELDPKVG